MYSQKQINVAIKTGNENTITSTIPYTSVKSFTFNEVVIKMQQQHCKNVMEALFLLLHVTCGDPPGNISSPQVNLMDGVTYIIYFSSNAKTI